MPSVLRPTSHEVHHQLCRLDEAKLVAGPREVVLDDATCLGEEAGRSDDPVLLHHAEVEALTEGAPEAIEVVVVEEVEPGSGATCHSRPV